MLWLSLQLFNKAVLIAEVTWYLISLEHNRLRETKTWKVVVKEYFKPLAQIVCVRRLMKTKTPSAGR
jgi:hypothetical protein